jgi:hypothetical protein
MAPQSCIARLSGTYRPRPPAARAALQPGPRGARPDLRSARRLTDVGGRCLATEFFPISRDLAGGCRLISLVMPAIPTNGLARPAGIILTVRIIRSGGVFRPDREGIKLTCTKRWDHRNGP